jgi:hypothetical protein
MNGKLPKLFMLGSSLPGERNGGGVVRDEILKRYPKDRFVCFSTNPLDKSMKMHELPESIKGVPSLISPLYLGSSSRAQDSLCPTFGC